MGWISAGLFVGLGLLGYATNRSVLNNAEGKIYTSANDVPNEPVALVLGTAPIFHGAVNPFFTRRMSAAAELYRAGKVKKILVSGDNGTVAYDEPTAMRDSLMKLGVPEKDIVLDYAGFRTLDSVVRAQKVFRVNQCTIVTDDFHLPRALYLAHETGIDAVGFQTAPLPRSVSPWTYVREVGARTLTWVDVHVINRQPRFLGRSEPILLASR